MAELAVGGEAFHVEKHGAVDHVGVAVVDDALDQRDDLGDVFGGAGIEGRALDAERVGILVIIGDGLFGQLLYGDAVAVGAGDHLVVDIGEVLHERDFVAAELEIAAQHVEDDEGARVADVKIVVYGGAAAVKGDLSFVQRDKGLLFTRQIVIKRKCHKQFLRSGVKLCRSSRSIIAEKTRKETPKTAMELRGSKGVQIEKS